ncbi:EthD family reductase [Halomarina ordinaria]|uniref:EthD family reductase n=1 Tax=Halomarina ordinaria TaxID=3033939 RepID=A0ABD5UCE1_9EURY|nr:EthD family reductase [Halomarina sp. PSRA2]
MYKATVCLPRNEGMSHEEYREYYENEHAPVVDDLPGVRRYTLMFVEEDDAPYDSVAEMWFDDREAYDRAMESDVMAELVADVDNFGRFEEVLFVSGEESVLIEESAPVQ